MSGERIVEPAAALVSAAAWRERGERVAWILGECDLLNAGHARAVAAARRGADRLIVAVRNDEAAAKALGEGRPVLPAAERARLVAALRGVDRVVIADEAAAARLSASLGQPEIGTSGAVRDAVARVLAMHGRGGA